MEYELTVEVYGGTAALIQGNLSWDIIVMTTEQNNCDNHFSHFQPNKSLFLHKKQSSF